MDLHDKIIVGNLEFGLENVYISVDDYSETDGGLKTPVTFSAQLEYKNYENGIALEAEGVSNSPAEAVSVATSNVIKKRRAILKGVKESYEKK